MRDVLARLALAAIPKILTLLDRNPHSPTYGCFDRNFWHYRIIDFPSGMAQECVLPLALAYALDLPDNPYHQAPAIREFIAAGIRFAAASAHRDGSCDDYFPYERAAGAAGFSLLACFEGARLINLRNDETFDFLRRRGAWLATHREPGRLSNHEALVVACLQRLSEWFGDACWRKWRDERLERLLSWQSEEGWFAEYEGADPGYLSLTIGLLADLERRGSKMKLRQPLQRAIAFAAEFVHPDGSYGGEYASRNTYNFFPHGFEIVGGWLPEALAVNDRVLQALAAGRGPCYDDDHLVAHHAWSYLLAWQHWRDQRPQTPPRAEGRRHFPQAGLLVDRRQGTELYLGLNKGGSFKLFRDGRLVASDTQVSLRLRDGRRRRTAVAHLGGLSQATLQDDGVTVEGRFGWAKQARMTPARMIALRLIMLAGGRWFPSLVRRLLQALLIVGGRPAPFRFRRTLTWQDGRWTVEDRVDGDAWDRVEAAGIGGFQTSIYAVMSRVFQIDQLQPWLDLSDRVTGLKAGDTLRVERTL
jgi:hypothetical protein